MSNEAQEKIWLNQSPAAFHARLWAKDRSIVLTSERRAEEGRSLVIGSELAAMFSWESKIHSSKQTIWLRGQKCANDHDSKKGCTPKVPSVSKLGFLRSNPNLQLYDG